jgi:hypothetical protein
MELGTTYLIKGNQMVVNGQDMKCAQCGGTEFDQGWVHAMHSSHYKSHASKHPSMMVNTDPRVHALACMKCGSLILVVAQEDLKKHIQK